MKTDRIVFLDYLRVVAIFMVIVVHSCECFYFGDNSCFSIDSKWNAGWLVAFDSASRAAVPLFVMASAYLLFPLKKRDEGGGVIPTGLFLRHRLLRVGIPFAIWCCLYNWHNGGSWLAMTFNFPMATGGHLWFVPMLMGLYLLMPLLSPWAERVTRRELRGWLLVWLATTTFPFLRKLCAAYCGAPSFGAIPYLYGECPWNSFGTFQYVSGFVGYMLLGLYFRKFAGEWSLKRTLAVAVPMLAVGWAAAAWLFYSRIGNYGATYPVTAPYAAAVDLEMSWEFCSLSVAMTVIGYFMIIRKMTSGGTFYKCFVAPVAKASFGIYLMHIFVLVCAIEWFKPTLTAPLAILATAAAVFAISAVVSSVGRRIPFIGKWIFGCRFPTRRKEFFPSCRARLALPLWRPAFGFAMTAGRVSPVLKRASSEMS